MDRRLLLSLIAGSVALPHIVRAVPLAPPQPFRLNLNNPHTGETFSGIYRDDNGPIPRVMEELSEFLRDFRAGEKIGIDVGVLDFLSEVMQAVGQTSATILSAYRTPETNTMLAKSGLGAAENSQHLYGRALDVHFGDKLADAMKAARAMQRGGVGWYPHSSFMHIDTGPVRNWDLDHKNVGTLLVGNHRVHFNKHGDMLVAAREQAAGASKLPAVLRGRGATAPATVSGKIPAMMHPGDRPLVTVGERLTRLRQIARASYVARH